MPTSHRNHSENNNDRWAYSVSVLFNFCKNIFLLHQQLKNVAKTSSSGHVEEIPVKDA